jgi:hypothetical protein
MGWIGMMSAYGECNESMLRIPFSAVPIAHASLLTLIMGNTAGSGFGEIYLAT